MPERVQTACRDLAFFQLRISPDLLLTLEKERSKLQNMINLNNLEQIKKLDKSNLLGSIEFLGKQCEQAWKEVKKIKIPANYRDVENIVLAAMGGSALGGHIVQSLFADQIKVPMEIIRGYSLPAYIGSKTLLILSSYSGNTEETLSAAYEGQKRKGKIVGFTTGGKLAVFLHHNNYPAYLFKPKHNPSNQPRMGLGYSVFGLLGFLKKCGLLKVKEKEIKEVIRGARIMNHELRVENKNSFAKKLAWDLKNRIPVLVGSEFLIGNIHAFANQINENAKCFSVYFELPELNHHLMEGLKNPFANKKNLIFILFNSRFYHPRNQKRYKILKEVLQRNKIDFIEYQPKTKTKFSQSLEILLLGSYVSFYLAMLYGLDPSPVPWVDFFKRRLES